MLSLLVRVSTLDVTVMLCIESSKVIVGAPYLSLDVLEQGE